MSDKVSDSKAQVPNEVGVANMRSAFRSTYRKMLVYATTLIFILMLVGFGVSYVSQDAANTINAIAYLAITPLFAIIGLYLLNKKLLYRETKNGIFVHRYKGRLAAMDSLPELALTTFFSVVLPYGLVFIPGGPLFTNPIGMIAVTCIKSAIVLFATLKLFQVMITRESTTPNAQINRLPYPNEYPSGDIRNTTSPISLGSPQYQNNLSDQYYDQFKSVRW